MAAAHRRSALDRDGLADLSTFELDVGHAAVQAQEMGHSFESRTSSATTCPLSYAHSCRTEFECGRTGQSLYVTE